MSEYVLAQSGAEELERERLRLLAELYDPYSRRQLDAIGVGVGWRCLDVGAGGGTVTRMLAERVGPAGSVLAIDLDPRLLEPLAGGHVEVARRDLMVDPLPEAAFDLAHARLLLMHLPSRVQALRRIVGAVRPGGWIAVVDVDFTTVDLSPRGPAWSRAWSALWDAAVAGGWDPSYGRRLQGDLEALELADVEVDRVVCDRRGGSLEARLLALTFERLRDRILALGTAEADVDAAIGMLQDENVRLRTPTHSIATARRA